MCRPNIIKTRLFGHGFTILSTGVNQDQNKIINLITLTGLKLNKINIKFVNINSITITDLT